MAGTVEKKLARARHCAATRPAADRQLCGHSCEPANLLVVSGQLCLDGDGKLVATASSARGVSIEDGQRAARACAVNLLAQIKAAVGDLDRSAAWCVSAASSVPTPGFLDGPKVMNGASDLMVEVFGDKGRHARTTVGVAALPLDAAVEVEGMFEVA